MNTMIHVIICDDEEKFIEHMSSMLDQYAAETGMEIKKTVCYDGLDLIEHYPPSADLFFLDIKMRHMDGIKTAQRIREMDERVGIVFVTTLSEYGLMGYQVQAVDYVIKPVSYIRLKDVIDRWDRRRSTLEDKSILICGDGRKDKLYLKDICYVETGTHTVLFHAGGETLEAKRSMKEVERELSPEHFVRCHTSYLVNLLYVKRAEKLELYLITGEILPISQPRRKEFMESLTDYWGDLL